MGVRGLSSYLTDFRTDLSVVHRFDGRRRRVPVIVDGLGVIFALYYAYLRWESGGEYMRFYHLVRRMVIAWRAVGLEPVFVFDGATPAKKHSTVMSRSAETLRNAGKFHAALAADGPLTSFGGKRILPMFCFDVCVAALRALKVSMTFVPDGEADAAVVALADKRAGYILGQDSDFVILAAGAPNVRGYIPLEGVQWVIERKRRTMLLPPASWKGYALHALVYSTPALCKHLGIPGNRLALLSSIVGNDYAQVFTSFWENVRIREQLEAPPPYWRIQYTAKVMQSMDPPVLTTEEEAIAYVRDVLFTLRGRYRQPRDEVVDAVIAATLQYALPRGDNCCNAFPFCGTEKGNGSCPTSTPAVQAYAKAQRAGRLKALTNAYMAPDRLYPSSLPEDPGYAPARSSTLGGGVRSTAYGIFFSAVAPRSEVMEYTRDTNFSVQPTTVAVPLSPRPNACLLPLHERIRLYLLPLGAQTATAIGKLPPRVHPLAAALRLCVLYPPVHGRWSHAELYAVARAALGTLAVWSLDDCDEEDATAIPPPPPLTNRTVQRVAQFCGALHDMDHLAKALLLVTPGGVETYLMGWKFVDGPSLHATLGGKEPGGAWVRPPDDEVAAVVAAALTGLGHDAVEAWGVGVDAPQPRKKLKTRKRSKPAEAGSGTKPTVKAASIGAAPPAALVTVATNANTSTARATSASASVSVAETAILVPSQITALAKSRYMPPQKKGQVRHNSIDSKT